MSGMTYDIDRDIYVAADGSAFYLDGQSVWQLGAGETPDRRVTQYSGNPHLALTGRVKPDLAPDPRHLAAADARLAALVAAQAGGPTQ
ncbi:MAG TPA: hypothetical protein VIO94_15880 [Phenylobacterium sp.]